MQRAHSRLARFISALSGLILLGASVTPGVGLAAPAGAPVLTVPGPQTVNEGSALSFTVSATDPDGQLVLLRASGLPAGATFRDNFNGTGLFTWTPDMFQAGSYLVRFTADDTFGGTDSKSVQVDVLNTNNAPVLDPIGDRSVERGGMLSIWISGYDPDGDALTFSQTGLPSYGSFTDFGDGNASLVLAPPANQTPGTTSMTITLSDGDLAASETFSITVYSLTGGTAPTLAPIGNQTMSEGQTKSLTVSASDADLEVLTWTVALPGFASLTPTGSSPGSATARLDLNPDFCAAGVHPASLGVSDGSLSATESFTITVTEANRAPAWTVPTGGYAMSIAEGSAADLTVNAADPDQACGVAAPALSLLSASVPPMLQASLADQGGGMGMLHVAAGFNAAGTYALMLRATDAAHPTSFVDVSVSVVVQATNRAPVASAGGPYGGLTGIPISFSAGGSSDPDGDALQYAWTFGDGVNGSGVTPSHAYAAPGHYPVTLTVSDGSLNAIDATTADASTSYEARAFMDPEKLRLWTGKPREAAYLEPVGRTFELAAVDLGSLRLSSPDGMGAVAYIEPIADKTVVGGDRDGNNVAEIRMEFTKEDLRSLFSNLDHESPVSLTVSGQLVGGGSIQASIGMDVLPQKGVLKKIGPNPMNPEAIFTMNLDAPGSLRLKLYDLNGRLVRTLVDESNLPAGLHEVRFDGRDAHGRVLSSGRYFYRVETDTEVSSGPVTILK